MNINSDNYYEVLGLTKNASDDEIRKAYKKIALKFHPDKNPNNKEDAEKNFKKINEAYSILGDKEKKNNYDAFGKSGLENNFNGFKFSNNDAHDIFSAFFNRRDPFEMMFNNDVFFEEFSSFGNNKFHNKSRFFTRSNFQNDSINISNNRLVIIRNLIKHKENNGKIGKIINYNINRERYDIYIKDSNKNISLKFDNLLQIISIEIINLVNKIHLNGEKGKVVGLNDCKDIYKISVNNAIINIKNTNIIIENNTIIKIFGLINNNYNGLLGKINSYDRDSNRYYIILRNNKILKLKPNNIHL